MDWFVAWVAAIAALATSEDVRWAGILGELDDIRAEAFASSDPSLLGRVYASGSEAWDADAALIRDYRARGAHVVGADLVVLSCRVKSASADRVNLRVIDRLAPTYVVWDDGARRSLPRDLPTRRLVTLIHTSSGWRIGN